MLPAQAVPQKPATHSVWRQKIEANKQHIIVALAAAIIVTLAVVLKCKVGMSTAIMGPMLAVGGLVVMVDLYLSWKKSKTVQAGYDSESEPGRQIEGRPPTPTWKQRFAQFSSDVSSKVSQFPIEQKQIIALTVGLALIGLGITYASLQGVQIHRAIIGSLIGVGSVTVVATAIFAWKEREQNQPKPAVFNWPQKASCFSKLPKLEYDKKLVIATVVGFALIGLGITYASLQGVQIHRGIIGSLAAVGGLTVIVSTYLAWKKAHPLLPGQSSTATFYWKEKLSHLPKLSCDKKLIIAAVVGMALIGLGITLKCINGANVHNGIVGTLISVGGLTVIVDLYLAWRKAKDEEEAARVAAVRHRRASASNEKSIITNIVRVLDDGNPDELIKLLPVLQDNPAVFSENVEGSTLLQRGLRKFKSNPCEETFMNVIYLKHAGAPDESGVIDKLSPFAYLLDAIFTHHEHGIYTHDTHGNRTMKTDDKGQVTLTFPARNVRLADFFRPKKS